MASIVTRQRVRGSAGAWTALALSAACLAAACSAPSDPDYASSEIAPGVFLIAGPDGNVVAAKGSGGLVVINGGRAENAPRLQRALARATGEKKIAAVVDTDWRPEHTGLNEVVGKAGGEIVAHMNARQWLQYGATDLATGETYEPLPKEALPTKLVWDEGGEIPLGGGVVKLGFLLQAHTDADLYAYFPDANVLVTGDAVRSDGWSMVHWTAGGYLGGLDDAFKALAQVGDDATVVVPGTGPLMTRADLAAQGEMYADMFMKVAQLVMDSQSPAEAVAAKPTGGYRRDWTDADEFVDRAQRSYRTHIRRDPRLPAIP